ncbi:hypothetical protein ACLI09_16310 [Flavobacterium sp. RHBU_24]|uniref:hypothetical protein n=1 Tax=Flavobacterium sp. RHBU_24 TaxID=3391185 RepID=UPI003984DCC6
MNYEVRKNLNNIVTITIIMLMAGIHSFAQGTGSFKGKIIEQSTKQPVIGAGNELLI